MIGTGFVLLESDEGDENLGTVWTAVLMAHSFPVFGRIARPQQEHQQCVRIFLYVTDQLTLLVDRLICAMVSAANGFGRQRLRAEFNRLLPGQTERFVRVSALIGEADVHAGLV